MALERHGIVISQVQLARFCVESHVRRLALFGSILTDRFRPDSDVDVLVEFEPGLVPGFQMELDLGAMFGRRVDLRTPQELSRYFRGEVVASALARHERS